MTYCTDASDKEVDRDNGDGTDVTTTAELRYFSLPTFITSGSFSNKLMSLPWAENLA